MKKRALILTLRYTLIMTVFYCLILWILGKNTSISGVIVGTLTGSIITFVSMRLFYMSILRSLDDLMSEIVDKHTDLIAHVPMNYIKKYFFNSIGGAGCLYKDKLVFIPHAMNFFRKEYTLFFYEIESMSRYKVFGIYNVGLIIVLKSGKSERFIIDKANQSFCIDLFNNNPR